MTLPTMTNTAYEINSLAGQQGDEQADQGVDFVGSNGFVSF